MIRLVLAMLMITLVVGGKDKVTEENNQEQAFLGRVTKLGVFALGIVTALIEIILYAKSFKSQNVVTFEVFGGTQELANNKPLSGAGESDRVIGTVNEFHKSEEQMMHPDPPTNPHKDIENIAKDMFKQAEQSLSARDRRKRRSHNLNLNKSQEKNENTS